MAELTKEQIEAAAKHAHHMWVNGDHDWNQIMADVAPFLQFPWDAATGDEVEGVRIAYLSQRGGDFESCKYALNDFIARRNAALLPKPVDTRKEKVLDILHYWLAGSSEAKEAAANAILAELDSKETR